jgi:hypothetical protein
MRVLLDTPKPALGAAEVCAQSELFRCRQSAHTRSSRLSLHSSVCLALVYLRSNRRYQPVPDELGTLVLQVVRLFDQTINEFVK